MNARTGRRSGGSTETTDRARRVAALVVLAVLVVGGIALAQTDHAGIAVTVPAHRPVDGPEVADARASSAAWYCAEGTSTADGRATETVIIGNLEPHAIDVETTVMPGGTESPVTERTRLEAYEQRRVEVARILRAAEPGVVVETFGGRAIVEHEITSQDDVAVGPCERAAARTWLFAEGSTERGAEDWLSLFNPFGTDAIVDVSFLTDVGVQTPDTVQALVVPRRSRVSVAVHDLTRRQLQVGIAVHARIGRIVAERSARFDGSDTRKGIALAQGATGGAPRWRFPVGDAMEGAAQSVSIANFTPGTAEVEVRLLLPEDRRVPPDTVAVPGNSVRRVDVGGKVAAGNGYAVDVRSKHGTPIVAGAFGAWATPAPVTAVATTSGIATSARQWAFALGRLTEDGDGIVSAVNVGPEPITVQIYAYTAGDPNSPASAPAEAVPPGERAVFSLGERGISPDRVIVVSADGPIVVGREIVVPGASIASGVPFPAGATVPGTASP
ncbi:MAG TPA: DUF5719 family protein [Acidimicrobiia bacterium]|jgi:hypothetical protein